MDANEKKKIQTEIERMEKTIVYFKGRERARARRRYLSLLCSNKKSCLLDEPIYFDRI